MSDVFNFGQVRAFDANGNPVPGALATFYIAGTNTLAPIKNAAGASLANPQTADASGVFAQMVYADVALKVNVTTAAGVALPGYPMEIAFRSSGVAAAASGISFAPTAEIPVTTVQAAIEAVQGNVGDGLVANQNLTDVPDKAAARTALGLVIGTNVQAYDAAQSSLAGLSLVAGDLLYATGADTLVRLAKGTAGQVLAINTGATAPEWVTPPGQTLLGTITTTSGATATLSGLTLTGYNVRCVFNGVSNGLARFPSTVPRSMRLNSGRGNLWCLRLTL